MNTSGDWRELRDDCLRDKVRVKPMTANQAAYIEAVRSRTLTFCTGPAGCGKTWLACGLAAEMFRAGEVLRIVLSRPLLACDEELGYLPGDQDDKTGPFMAPMLDAFGEFFAERELEEMGEDGRLEVCPLATMRGRNFKDAFCILDEAQNATRRQLLLFLTRFGGKRPKVVVCGDPTQADLPGGHLSEAIERLWGDPEVGVVRLGKEDVVRHGLVQRIIERMGLFPRGSA